MLCDHVTFGSSSTHLPLHRLNNILDIVENNILFAISMAPFDSGW